MKTNVGLALGLSLLVFAVIGCASQTPVPATQQQIDFAKQLDAANAAIVQTGQVVAAVRQQAVDASAAPKTADGQIAAINAATPIVSAAAGLAGGPGWGTIATSLGSLLAGVVATRQMLKTPAKPAK
jgi:hypothetical protein